MFKTLNTSEIEYIYNTFMVKDFPPDELKPLKLLLKMVETGFVPTMRCLEAKRCFLILVFVLKAAMLWSTIWL